MTNDCHNFHATMRKNNSNWFDFCASMVVFVNAAKIVLEIHFDFSCLIMSKMLGEAFFVYHG